MSYSLAFTQAIAMLTYIAIKVDHGMYEFVPTKEIAHTLHISPPSAVKLLHSLSHAGVIETREGARGGIRLARAPHTISLYDVFAAIEGTRPLFRDDQQVRLSDDVVDRVRVRLAAAFQAAETAMKTELRAVTIADLYH